MTCFVIGCREQVYEQEIDTSKLDVSAAVSENPVPSNPGEIIRKYKVMPGDDVYAVAIMFNVSVQALKNLNNLTTDKPAPGTELIIPAD